MNMKVILLCSVLGNLLTADVNFIKPIDSYSTKDAVKINLKNSVYLYGEIAKANIQISKLSNEIEIIKENFKMRIIEMDKKEAAATEAKKEETNSLIEIDNETKKLLEKLTTEKNI